MSDTYVYSIYVLENGCAAHQELEDFDKNENDDIYTYVEQNWNYTESMLLL